MRPICLYPSHGETPVGGEKVGNRQIAQDLKHRADREAQVLQALSKTPASIEEIVARVYGHLPEDLHRGASKGHSAMNTGHYLAELVRREQAIQCNSATWSLP